MEANSEMSYGAHAPEVIEQHTSGMNQASAFAAFRQAPNDQEDKKKDQDGSDTEEEMVDLVSMSSYTTQKTSE